MNDIQRKRLRQKEEQDKIKQRRQRNKPGLFSKIFNRKKTLESKKIIYDSTLFKDSLNILSPNKKNRESVYAFKEKLDNNKSNDHLNIDEASRNTTLNNAEFNVPKNLTKSQINKIKNKAILNIKNKYKEKKEEIKHEKSRKLIELSKSHQDKLAKLTNENEIEEINDKYEILIDEINDDYNDKIEDLEVDEDDDIYDILIDNETSSNKTYNKNISEILDNNITSSSNNLYHLISFVIMFIVGWMIVTSVIPNISDTNESISDYEKIIDSLSVSVIEHTEQLSSAEKDTKFAITMLMILIPTFFILIIINGFRNNKYYY